MPDLNDTAKKLLDTEEGRKIAGKKDELQKLASGSDGQRVMEMLSGNHIESALKSGDTEGLKSAIQNAMNTEEGARFMREISKLMGK